jgi:2-C-methyl-D-erythritol 4-phosphate cytidylyltransferase
MAGQVFAVILAGGTGSRMGNTEKPKQFIEIGQKPIVIHTIEKFYVHAQFEKILLLTPSNWVKPTEDLINKYFSKTSKIQVLKGGTTRNETIMNSIRYIEENYGLTDDTVVVTHDAVRPFVTYRIIEENIKCAMEYGACDTVIPASDTIVRSDDNKCITEIPDRKLMYQGQTPQSFKAKVIKKHYESLSDGDKDVLTDAAKIMVLKGERVHLVQGEVFNIKITYPYDIRVAQSLIEEEIIVR